MTIPKLSTPLAKGIRTTEGILTSVISTLIVLCSLVDPNALPKKEGAILLAATGALYTLQRGLIKVVAIQKGLGVGAPIDDPKLDAVLAKVDSQGESISNLVSSHSELINDVEATVTKGDLSDLLQKLEEYLDSSANAARQPVQPAGQIDPGPDTPTDPLAEAMGAVTPADENAEQPPPEVTKLESARKPDPPAPEPTPVPDNPPDVVAPALDAQS